MNTDRDHPLFEIRGLIKSYEKRTVLDISRLSLEKGRRYSVVGPNGSGKTTLLRILAGLEPPTSGEVFYRGERMVTSLAAIRHKITMVMQNPFLFRTNVYRNVAYGLEVRGIRGKELRTRVEETLTRVGLSNLERRQRDQLSAGEARRVAMARSLALKPEVLLLDEPTGNLDARASLLVEAIIRAVNREDEITVISATPDSEQAQRLGDEAIVLLEGRVAANPIDNLFSGELVGTGGEKQLLLTEGISLTVVTQKEGRAHLSVDPEDIVLSLQPFTSSARNCFRGKVVRAVEEEASLRLWIEAGVTFVALVTKSSYRKLGLNLGSEVYLTFKASSVHVY